MADSLPRQVSFQVALAPILALLSLILYGLILRPQWYGQDAFPLEVIFITGASLAIAYLFALGIQWKEIEQSIVDKLQRALPAFFILFTIGMLIGSWLVCGTIPMMVYWGLQLISPSLFYLLAFLIPVVFSLLTGTSWGSVGAIGIVIMGICGALGADPGITAGAVIGGAFFGDKMSPLSDTTNLAALAAEVDLFDHIRSMMYSTVPSAILAATVYTIVGFL